MHFETSRKQVQRPQGAIANIIVDVWLSIVDFLDDASLGNLLLSDSTMYGLLRNDVGIWKRRHVRKFKTSEFFHHVYDSSSCWREAYIYNILKRRAFSKRLQLDPSKLHTTSSVVLSDTLPTTIHQTLPPAPHLDSSKKTSSSLLLHATYMSGSTLSTSAANTMATRPLRPFPAPYLPSVFNRQWLKRVGYFEVQIVNKGQNGSIGIGLAQLGIPNVGYMPGWRAFKDSYGLHLDDSYLFHDGGFRFVGGADSPRTFVSGDVIGCGYDYETETMFFTHNGKMLDAEAFSIKNVRGMKKKFPWGLRPNNDNYYPVCGMNSPMESVKFNFGREPFVFHLDAYMNNEDV